MADTTISFDADTTAMDRKLRDQRSAAGQIGMQYVKGFAAAAIGAGAMVAAVRRAVSAAEDFKKSMGEANRAAGQAALRVANAQRRQGLGMGASAATMELLRGGARSRDEGATFVETLASRYGRTLTEDQSNAALQAFMSGVYSQDEALDQAQAGGFDIAGRKRGLPQMAAAELAKMEADKAAAIGTGDVLTGPGSAREDTITTAVSEYNKRAGATGALIPDLVLRRQAAYAMGDQSGVNRYLSRNDDDLEYGSVRVLRQILSEMKRPALGARSEESR